DPPGDGHAMGLIEGRGGAEEAQLVGKEKGAGKTVVPRGGAMAAGDLDGATDEVAGPAQRFCWQDMHSRACGNASSRAGAMSLPHRSQRPNVPSAIRFKAASTSAR